MESLDQMLAAQYTTSDSGGNFMLDQTKNVQHTLWCFVREMRPVLLDNVYPSSIDVIVRVGGIADITGVVIDNAGAAIAGAKISCMTQGEWPPMIVGATESDHDGRFLMNELPTGLVAIRVVADGFADAKRTLTLPVPKNQGVEVSLDPEAPFKGHVVDHLGHPVAGALVQIHDRDQDCEPSRMETTADGSFWSINVPAKHRLEIWVSSTKTFDQRYFGFQAPCQDAILVFLPNAGIKGSVIDPEKRPIKNFELLRITSLFPFEREISDRQHSWEQIHDDNGSFVVGIPPSDGSLMVRANGFETKTIPISNAKPGEYLPTLTVQLRRGAVISGRVVDTEGGPISGAMIAIADVTRNGESVLSEGLGQTTAAGDGSFMLAQAGTGPFDLIVRRPGFGQLRLRDQRVEDFPRDLALAPAGAIHGVVTIPWRSPETVTEILVRPIGTWLATRTRADARGRFNVDGLAGGPHIVELQDKWMQITLGASQIVSTIVDVVPGETTFVELESGTGCVVEGTVHSASKSSIPDRFEVVLIERREGRDKVRAYSSADSAGWYSLGRVPVGSFVARVRSREPGTLVGTERPLDILAGRDHITLDFTVEATGIEGAVGSADGGAVDAMVGLVDLHSGGLITEAPTDREGRYRILLRHDGRALVWVRARGFAEGYDTSVDLSGASEQAPLEHVLAPESRVTVEVVDDRGARVGSAEVQLDVAGRPSVLPVLRAQTDPSGRWTFSQLAQGAMQVAARRKGYVPSAILPLVVAEGETRAVRLVLTRCGSLDVTATDGRGRPAPSVSVEVRPASDDPAAPRQAADTNAEGRARFVDLAPGAYEALTSNGDPIRVEIHPGETTRVELFVERR